MLRSESIFQDCFLSQAEQIKELKNGTVNRKSEAAVEASPSQQQQRKQRPAIPAEAPQLVQERQFLKSVLNDSTG